jgi:membrane associated rhomboid family serine protease
MLIPLSDENEDFDTPWVNRLIIAICLLVFAYECFLSDKHLDDFINAFGFNAHDYVQGKEGLKKFGGAAAATFNLLRTGWITAVTALFIHAGFMHVAGNMLFLWIFGASVEHAMGRVRYFAFFILMGVLANFMQAWIGMDANLPCIGASGAISGIMGAYMVFYPRALINVMIWYSIYYEPYVARWRAWHYLLFFFVTQMLTGLLTWGDKYFDVAVWAHIGGFAFGAALAWFFKDPAFLFKEEGEKMLGLDGSRPTDAQAYSEFALNIGRRAGFSGDTDFGPTGKRIHRRPPLKEMRKKGYAERAETKKKRGW